MPQDVSPVHGAYANTHPAGIARVPTDGKHAAFRSDVFRVRGVTYWESAARENGIRFPYPVVEVASLRRRVGRATSRTEHANRL